MFQRLSKLLREITTGGHVPPEEALLPPLSTSASPLEDRRLLSAGAGKEHAAVAQAVTLGARRP